MTMDCIRKELLLYKDKLKVNSGSNQRSQQKIRSLLHKILKVLGFALDKKTFVEGEK